MHQFMYAQKWFLKFVFNIFCSFCGKVVKVANVVIQTITPETRTDSNSRSYVPSERDDHCAKPPPEVANMQSFQSSPPKKKKNLLRLQPCFQSSLLIHHLVDQDLALSCPEYLSFLLWILKCHFHTIGVPPLIFDTGARKGFCVGLKRRNFGICRFEPGPPECDAGVVSTT
jgi:hypothetical protein